MAILQVLHDTIAVNEELLYIQGYINDEQFLILVDTGASINFIASEVAKSRGLEDGDCP